MNFHQILFVFLFLIFCLGASVEMCKEIYESIKKIFEYMKKLYETKLTKSMKILRKSMK